MSLPRPKFQEPPKGFNPAKGVLEATLLAAPPSFITRPAKYGAKGRGVAYEAKAQNVLCERYEERYVPGPWLVFRDLRTKGKWRYCQPDGLIFDPYRGRITIVEIKYNHCELAWWQLFRLYLPTVAKAFGPQWTYACCEVVKWYDSATKVPEKVQLQREIVYTTPETWGVHILNPGRV